MRCYKCGCEVKIVDGLHICVNCGVVGQEDNIIKKEEESPSYCG